LIVVDTNTVAYFCIPGTHSDKARSVYAKDDSWAAPVLWRSEFRNLLLRYLRNGSMRMDEALACLRLAERSISESLLPSSEKVLMLAADSGCTAYDCEFAVLAKALAVPLVTSDKKMLAAFPEVAVSPDAFIA